MIHSVPPKPLHPTHRAGTIGNGFTPGGRVGLHGMVTFGDPRTGIFMSHIPMFHVPHDVQGLFEVRVPEFTPKSPGELFTFKPKPFSLDDLVLGTLKVIRGTVFRGNFERPDSEPVADVAAEVRRVVFANPLDQEGKVDAPLEYRLIGTPDNAFLVHTVARGANAEPPDFDQVLSVELPPGSVSASEFAGGISFTVPGRANQPSARLKLGSVEVEKTGSDVPVKVRVRHEISFLVGPEFTSGDE